MSACSRTPNKAWHDKLVSLVERMLELHKRSPRLPQEQESLQRTGGLIFSCMSCPLKGMIYGLTDEEINIVERKI